MIKIDGDPHKNMLFPVVDIQSVKNILHFCDKHNIPIFHLTRTKIYKFISGEKDYNNRYNLSISKSGGDKVEVMGRDKTGGKVYVGEQKFKELLIETFEIKLFSLEKLIVKLRDVKSL